MTLILEHPQIANLSCETCQKWIVDIKTGEFATRRGERQQRKPGQPTPCHLCPKVSPAVAKQKELSKKNWVTLRLFLEHRALSGVGLPEELATDPILRHNFAAIDTTFRRWESKQVARSVGNAIGDRFDGKRT